MMLRIRISHEARPCELTIETKNRISAECREGIDELFAFMVAAESPTAFYQAAMKRARTRKQGSGLGIARIHAEGEMMLQHGYVDDEVTITAIAVLPEVAS
jgi:hypothetical protein